MNSELYHYGLSEFNLVNPSISGRLFGLASGGTRRAHPPSSRPHQLSFPLSEGPQLKRVLPTLPLHRRRIQFLGNPFFLAVRLVRPFPGVPFPPRFLAFQRFSVPSVDMFEVICFFQSLFGPSLFYAHELIWPGR